MNTKNDRGFQFIGHVLGNKIERPLALDLFPSPGFFYYTTGVFKMGTPLPDYIEGETKTVKANPHHRKMSRNVLTLTTCTCKELNPAVRENCGDAKNRNSLICEMLIGTVKYSWGANWEMPFSTTRKVKEAGIVYL